MTNMVTLLILIVAFGIIGTVLYAVQKWHDAKRVRVIVHWKTRRVGIYKREPENNHVSVKGCTFKIDDEHFTEYKGMRTYVYSEDDPQPLDPYNLTQAEPDPRKLNVGIKNTLIERMINAGDKGFRMDANLSTILLFVIIGALGLVAYLGYTAISNLQNDIEIIRAWVDSFGGGA